MSIFSRLWKKIKGWFSPDVTGERGVNIEKSGTNQPVPVIYGFQKKAPCIKVFKATTDKSGGAKNEYLHLICVFCAGEVDNIGSLYFNDIAEGAIANKRYTVERYTGSETQLASSSLTAQFSQWKSTAKLSNVAYVYVRLKQNKKTDWWQGEPKVSADIRGKKVLDPRDSIIKYSNNIALCLYDYLTDTINGKGLPPSKINTQSFIDAANFIETSRTYTRTVYRTEYDPESRTWVTIPVGVVDETVTENIMSCNVSLGSDKTIKTNVETLLKGMRGILPETNGKYRVSIEKDDTPVFAFTKDNISGAIQCQGGSQSDRYNQVIIRFRNILTGEEDEAVYPDNDAQFQTWLTEDNNKKLLGEFTFDTINNKAEALQMGQVIAKRSRNLIGASFSAFPETLVVEAGDVVSIDSSIFGWNAKPFRIEHVEIDLKTGKIDFQAVEHQNNIYPWAITDVTEEYADTSFALPNNIATPTGLVFENLPAGGAHQGRLYWNAVNDNNVSSHVVNIYQGNPTYIWIMFANDATGAGISSIGAGKTYIGVSFNRASSLATTNPLDYTWVLADSNGILMPNSVSGENRYLWLKFTVQPPNNPLLDLPNDYYIGYASGKTEKIKSTNNIDYTWLYNVNSILLPHDGFHVLSIETLNNEIYTDNLNLGFHTIEVNAKNRLFESNIAKLINEVTTDFNNDKPSIKLTTDNRVFFTDKAGVTTPNEIIMTVNHTDPTTDYSNVAWTTTPNILITNNAQSIIVTAEDFGTNNVVNVTAQLNGLTDNIDLLHITDGVDGIDGSQGTPGAPGANGQASYFHIAYADNDSGGGFSQNPVGKTYIGTYVDFTPADSTNTALYSWALIQGSQGADGSQGIPGSNGANGQTSYFHIAYADNASGGGFSQNPAGKTHIGTYVDFTPTDSSNPALYTWVLVQGNDGSAGPKGDQGTPGAPGANGQTSYFHIAYADNASGGGFSQNPTGKTYIGTYVDFSPTDSSSAALYSWALIQGSQGADGSQGIPGSNGANGQTSYLHIAYADNASGGGFSQNPSGKTHIGTYVDFTPTDSSNPALYTWVLVQGSQGEPGIPGPTGPTYNATVISDSGSFGFYGARTAWKTVATITVPAGTYSFQMELTGSVVANASVTAQARWTKNGSVLQSDSGYGTAASVSLSYNNNATVTGSTTYVLEIFVDDPVIFQNGEPTTKVTGGSASGYIVAEEVV